MDLQLLRSLLTVSDTGSITEAADRIGITQPALSRRLQQLEEHLGAELLNRGRKGAELTEIGRLVVTESGIHTPQDVAMMRSHGVDAFLVGEAFMRAPDPGAKLAQLFA